MVTIAVNKIRIVRESNHRYDLPSRHICNPQDAFNIIREVLKLNEEAQEVFAVLLLNSKNCVTGVCEVSRGSINASIVTCREVFKSAIMSNTARILLTHNHPSGDLTPSNEDIHTTRNLIDAGKMLDIAVIDHIIIGHNSFISLREKEMVDF